MLAVKVSSVIVLKAPFPLSTDPRHWVSGSLAPKQLVSSRPKLPFSLTSSDAPSVLLALVKIRLGPSSPLLQLARGFKEEACKRGAARLPTGRFILSAIIMAIALPPAAVAQVLPPPLLPEQGEMAQELVQAFDAKDSAAYAQLLADDLQVFEDGRLIAQNKAEWLAQFGPKLSAPGVSFELISGFASTGRMLFVEYFNSIASWGRTPPPHCCWGYDAVSYDIAEGKIQVIRRLRGGDTRIDQRHEPAGT